MSKLILSNKTGQKDPAPTSFSQRVRKGIRTLDRDLQPMCGMDRSQPNTEGSLFMDPCSTDRPNVRSEIPYRVQGPSSR
jgi:hypothetical protein